MGRNVLKKCKNEGFLACNQGLDMFHCSDYATADLCCVRDLAEPYEQLGGILRLVVLLPDQFARTDNPPFIYGNPQNCDFLALRTQNRPMEAKVYTIVKLWSRQIQKYPLFGDWLK